MKNLADYTRGYLSEYGVDLPESVAKIAAEELLASFVGEGALTAEHIKEFFQNYRP